MYDFFLCSAPELHTYSTERNSNVNSILKEKYRPPIHILYTDRVEYLCIIAEIWLRPADNIGEATKTVQWPCTSCVAHIKKTKKRKEG